MERGSCATNNQYSNEPDKSKQNSWMGNIWNWWVSCLVLPSKLSNNYLYLRSSKDPVNSSVTTEDVMKIRRKRTEEAEEALAGGLSKANIFMSF